MLVGKKCFDDMVIISIFNMAWLELACDRDGRVVVGKLRNHAVL